MKRNIITWVLAAFASVGFAQTEYEALRLSQTDIVGTARYVSLGGAMGALGGDASAIKDNPAGLGVYRSSELTSTFSFSQNKVGDLDWYGIRNGAQAFNGGSSFDNVSYIVANPTDNYSGLQSSNFSFSYQKLKDFNKKFKVDGRGADVSFTNYLAHFSSPSHPLQGEISFDNIYMPWLTVLGYRGYLIDPVEGGFTSLLGNGELVDPSYTMYQSGSLSEMSLAWSGNFNNNLFLGGSINMRSLEYNFSSVLTEHFHGGGGFDLESLVAISGIGVNAKIGAIYLPTSNLRLGAALHTASSTFVDQESVAYLSSSEIPENEKNPVETGVYKQDYLLKSPMQAQLSAAYLFGQSGFISGEYNYIRSQGTRLKQTINSSSQFGDINSAMPDVLNNVNVWKVGAEWRVTPRFALRAGFANVSPAVNADYRDGKLLVSNSVMTNTEFFNQIFDTNYYSFGAGYRTGRWFVDFAYMIREQSEDFFAFQDKALLPVELDHRTNNWVLSLGLRF